MLLLLQHLTSITRIENTKINVVLKTSLQQSITPKHLDKISQMLKYLPHLIDFNMGQGNQEWTK